MTKPRIVHLLEDGSFGGVTENLKLFDRPELTERYDILVRRVSPIWSAAPKISADIIVIHYTHSWSRLPYLWSLRQRNRKAVIIHMEHSYSKEWAQISVPNMRRFGQLMKYVSRNVDHIICVSDAQRKWLSSLAPAFGQKSCTINPYSEMDDLKNLDLAHIQKGQTITIGTFGRFNTAKGFEQLINIFNQLPQGYNIRLLIGGFGELEERLRTLSAFNSEIEFVGRVENKAAFMQQCDVIIIPSRYETFGLTAAEAKAAGRPVLVANVGALTEQISDPRQICDFDKPSEVLGRLSSLSAMPLERFAKQGRADMTDFEERIVRGWTALFDKVLNRLQPV